MVRPTKRYRGIIINHMVKEQLDYSYEKNIGWRGKWPVFRWDIKYEPLWQNATKLYDAIDCVRKKKRWPKMSWSTHVKYLKEMVDEHTLTESRERRKYNETLYRLSEHKLATYLRYLLTSKVRLSFLTQTPLGDRPYSYLLLWKLYVQLIHMDAHISVLPKAYFSAIRQIH